MKRIIILAIGNTSWWKSIKYRNESSLKLLKLRNSGWKLERVRKLKKSNETIDTKIYQKYYLYK